MARGEDRRRPDILCHRKEDQSEFVEERRFQDLTWMNWEVTGFSNGLFVEMLFYLRKVQTEFLEERGQVRAFSKNSDGEQYTWELAAGGSFTGVQLQSVELIINHFVLLHWWTNVNVVPNGRVCLQVCVEREEWEG